MEVHNGDSSSSISTEIELLFTIKRTRRFILSTFTYTIQGYTWINIIGLFVERKRFLLTICYRRNVRRHSRTH